MTSPTAIVDARFRTRRFLNQDKVFLRKTMYVTREPQKRLIEKTVHFGCCFSYGFSTLFEILGKGELGNGMKSKHYMLIFKDDFKKYTRGRNSKKQLFSKANKT